MMMEKRRKSDPKWFQKNPNRNWDLKMIPSISRPSSRKAGSLQNSVNDADWVSLGGARSLSGSNSIFESPKTSSYFAKRRQSRGDIEDILSKHQVARPRSVSLVKYDPLPAINSDISKTPLSKTPPSATEERVMGITHNSLILNNEKMDGTQISPIEEHEAESEAEVDNTLTENSSNLKEEEKEKEVKEEDSSPESGKEEKKTLTREEVEENAENSSSEEKKDWPPKLVRSRTFDVIETNLTNLPVIDDSTSDKSDDLQTEGKTVSLGDSEKVQLVETKPKFEVCVSVNGVALNTFLSQSDEDPSLLSPISLVNHPGTPDSGFAVESERSDRDPNFDRHNDDGSDFSDNESTNISSSAAVQPIENKILVKFPDDKDVHLKFNFDITLRDFLSTLETLEWEEQSIRVVDKIDDKLLSEPLFKFPFKKDTQVSLIPNM